MTIEQQQWIMTPDNAPDDAELHAWETVYESIVGPRPANSVCVTKIGA